MSDEIYREDMAYVGDVPWHGKGTRLQPGSSIERWAAAAGFEWYVEKTPIPFMDGLYPDRVILYRSDNRAPLSIASTRYKLVQPMEVLEFFRDLCESQGFQMETAGMLRGGTTYWALALTGREAQIRGEQILAYTLIATSCDGSLATQTRLTSVRVVCNNTLQMSMLGGEGSKVITRHSTVFDPDKVKRDLKLVNVDASWDAFIASINKLSEFPFTDNRARRFFAELLNVDLADEVEHPARFRTFNRLWAEYERTRPAIANTAWGAVNAVTQYIDHDKPVRDADNRLDSAWFGSGQQLKSRALALAEDIYALEV